MYGKFNLQLLFLTYKCYNIKKLVEINSDKKASKIISLVDAKVFVRF